MLLLGSLVFQFVGNISSVGILSVVSVVSHQVATTLKRLVVIAVSILVFQNPVTLWNGIGIALAVAGFFLYVRASDFNKYLPSVQSEAHLDNLNSAVGPLPGVSSSADDARPEHQAPPGVSHPGTELSLATRAEIADHGAINALSRIADGTMPDSPLAGRASSHARHSRMPAAAAAAAAANR
jgi:hypothetical protein